MGTMGFAEQKGIYCTELIKDFRFVSGISKLEVSYPIAASSSLLNSLLNLLFVVRLQFPLILDMEPYTAEGMAWREELAQNSSDIESSSSVVFDIPSNETLPSDAVFATADIKRDHHSSEVFARASNSLPSVHVSLSHTTNHINYELVGVVVHSGQANAGHYYSFIKERRCVQI